MKKPSRVPGNDAQPDPDNNLGRGAPGDRDERIRQRARENGEREARQEKSSPSYKKREAQDLDREDAEIQREGIAGEKPGIRPRGDADFARDKS